MLIDSMMLLSRLECVEKQLKRSLIHVPFAVQENDGKALR